VFQKAGTSKALFSREITKFEELLAQKKAVEQDIKLKQELHIKSVMFERDNLQMELEEALGQIERL
jgi:hypothetical protein